MSQHFSHVMNKFGITMGCCIMYIVLQALNNWLIATSYMKAGVTLMRH